MQVTILDSTADGWNSRIEQIVKRLPREEQPFHFPLYFLQSTLPRIGGKVAIYTQDRQEIALGLLFPRFIDSDGTAIFTLRFHHLIASPSQESLPAQTKFDPANILLLTNQQIAPQRATFYDPLAHHDYTQSVDLAGNVEIGRPSQEEAAQIPSIQAQVWGATPEECYPADLHSTEFSLGSSLVARVDGKQAGFLIGFYKFGGYPLPTDWQERFNGDLRLESQIMGVLPQFRGLRISNLLKQQQARNALAQGIGIINWTADPLQYINVALNFGLLRAVSFDFLPNLYSFRNELNRVPASRLGLSWLIKSEHVQQNFAHDARSTVLDLAHHPAIPRANEGWSKANFDIDAPLLVFEIPVNWNAIQRDNITLAQRWRETTDQLFAHYIGKDPGKYTITGVGVDGERRFLIGQQSGDALFAQLGRTE